MLTRLIDWTDRLLQIFAVAGVGVLGAGIVLVVVDVALRSTIGFAITGTVDVTQLCVMAVAFWAIPLAFIRGGHVNITLATDWLPARVNAVVDGLAALGGLVFVGLALRYGIAQAGLALAYGDVSQTIAIPMIVYWAFPLSGLALACLATAVLALRHFALALTGRDPHPVAKPEALL